MADKRIRNNRFNIEWCFAKESWTAAKNGLPAPEVPKYQIYEVDPVNGSEKLIKELPITPMKVVCNGNTYFG